MSASDRARRAVRAATAMLALPLLLAACGGEAGEGQGGQAAPGSGSGSGSGAAAAPAAAGTPSTDGTRAAEVTATSPARAAAPAADAGSGTRELSHPEDLQMLLLAYRLEGRTPPIAEWAAAQHRVAAANEFDRAAVRDEEQARLQAVYDGTEGIGLLRMNVNARISEYDGSRGGYYLDAFTPGSVFQFSARPAPNPFRDETVSLRIDNPGELNFWPMDPAAAQEVLARNNGQRHVTLDSRLRITGINRRSTGAELTATLLGYSIVSTKYGQPAVLGERRFDGGDGSEAR